MSSISARLIQRRHETPTVLEYDHILVGYQSYQMIGGGCRSMSTAAMLRLDCSCLLFGFVSTARVRIVLANQL